MKTYMLAKDREFAVVPFGPLMTLKEAQFYQDELAKAGKNVLVVNAATLVEGA